MFAKNSIAKTFCEISKLRQLDGVEKLPKPILEGFVFMSNETVSKIISLLKSSYDLHKETLELRDDYDTKDIASSEKIKTEIKKIDAETVEFNTKANKELDAEIVKHDDDYNKELIQLKKEYEEKCERAKERRNAKIDKSTENSKKRKAAHLAENDAKKILAKEEILKDVNASKIKFENSLSKLNKCNSLLASNIKESNDNYLENKEIFEEFERIPSA